MVYGLLVFLDLGPWSINHRDHLHRSLKALDDDDVPSCLNAHASPGDVGKIAKLHLPSVRLAKQVENKLAATRDPQPLKNAKEMVLDRVLTQLEHFSDFPVS